MSESIRIGIICNAEFRDELDQALAEADPQFEFEVRCYAHQDEAAAFTRELETQVDAILYSGPVPYYIALEQGPISVPSDFVVYDEVSLLKAFFELQRRAADLSTISVDTISVATINDVCREIGVDATAIRSMPLHERGIHDDFARFHIDNYRSGSTSYALTCRSVVKKQLEQAGVPCHFMFWTKHTILKALDLLVSRYLQTKYRGSQIAVGLLRVKLPERDVSIADQQRMRLEMQAYLLESAQRLGLSLLDIGDGLYFFCTTYGALKAHTQDFTTAPYFPPLPTHKKYNFHVGIGTGPNATIAEDGARKALHRAEMENRHSAFIILDNDRLIGPLGSNSSARLIRVSDAEISRLAETIGITTANLARIFQALELDKDANYSAAELSAILNTTPRTARRVLNRLTEAGYAQVVGESQPVGQGRPTTIYKITLSNRQGASL